MNLLARRHQPTNPAPDTFVGPQGLFRNLMTGRDGVTAWFLLSPATWDFRDQGSRRAHLDAATLRFTEITGHRTQIRVLNRAADGHAWAKRLDESSPRHLPAADGIDAWTDYLHGAQRQMNALRLESLDVYLGVRISTKRVPLTTLERVFRRDHTKDATLLKLRKEVREVTESMKRAGLGGRPVTARALGYLLHSSAAIGLPVPSRAFAGTGDFWTQADLDAVAESVEVTQTPYAGHVTVTANRGGRTLTHHVAILTLGAMRERDLDDPSLIPWMAYTARFDFPIQWSAILDVLDGNELAGKARLTRKVAQNQAQHYRDHKEDPPELVERQIAAAERMEREVTAGHREDAVRVMGQFRMAVSAHTVEELEDRISLVIEGFAREQKMTVEHPRAQAALYAEFTPGNGRASNGGHVRSMPAKYLASAVPNLASGLGDGVGPYIGPIIGSGRQPLAFDPVWGPQHDYSGLITVNGQLGSGKSTFAGGVIESSVLRGYRTIVNDPSGPLARLCALPHLRRYARHIELSSADRGVLNPYHLVPDPLRVDHLDETAWNQAVAEAASERRELVIDTFLDLLPPSMFTSGNAGRGIHAAIEAAVSEVEAEYAQSPWAAVDLLTRSGEIGADVASALRVASGLKGGSLIFPDTFGDHQNEVPLDTAVLTVLTMRGLTPAPAGTPRDQLTRAERMAKPVMHLASRYATRAMYEDKAPKLIVTDELGQIAGSGSSYRNFLTRGSLDSRKHNTGFMLMGQNPSHLTSISDEITNLIGAAFVGRLTSADAATAAMRLLGVPTGHGYEQVPLSLPSGKGEERHFIMRDWIGRVGVFAPDFTHRPDLFAALDTTPLAERTESAVEDDLFVGALA